MRRRPSQGGLDWIKSVAGTGAAWTVFVLVGVPLMALMLWDALPNDHRRCVPLHLANREAWEQVRVPCLEQGLTSGECRRVAGDLLRKACDSDAADDPDTSTHLEHSSAT